MIESRKRMRWEGHVTGVEEIRKAYKILVRKHEWKRLFGRTRRRCEDIRMDVREVGESRDSSVGIALGYGLDDRGSRVRFPARAENFSLHHRIQNSSGAHPASYPMGTRGSFLGGKVAGA
jgi:hypothetical protein